MNECTYDRHNAVVLVAGDSTENGLHCLKGSVTVCQDCRRFLGGVSGSVYLNCHGQNVVNSSGRVVYFRTISEAERAQFVQTSS